MKRLLTSFFVLLFAALTWAQMGISFDAESGYASNIFSNYSQLPDYYNNISGLIHYDKLSDARGTRLFYNGAGRFFQQYDYRNYQTHSLGVSYYRYLGDRGHKLNAGANASMRLHSEDYKWYEYRQGYAFAALKMLLSDQLYGYVGVNFKMRDYTLLTPYSYWQNMTYVRVSRFYNSGSSVIAEVDYMQKQYLSADIQSPLESFPYTEMDGEGSSRQVVALLKFGQAVNPKTGLGLQLLLRRNINSSVRYLISDAGYYYSDEELFDDVFGYEAEQLRLTLKRRLPWRMQASFGASATAKHYINRRALDLQGYPFEDGRLRDDTRFIAFLTLTKTLSYSRSMAPVRFNVDFTYIVNNSNDPYYHYKTNYISFGISQSF